MATKWKNTDDRSKWAEILDRNRDLAAFAGAVLMVVGGACFLVLLIFRDEIWDEMGILMGFLGNLLFCPGVVLLIRQTLQTRFGEWMPEGEKGYEEWKSAARKMERRFLQAGTGVFLLTAMYMLILILGYPYYMSYVSGYILMLTALLQTMAAEWTVHRFWGEKLDLVLEKAEETKEEIIRRRIEEAREIERKSMEKVSRSDQLRIDLITNVSHDLKTPLTSMVGYIELMKKEEMSDVMKDYVDVLSERAGKLGEMINSLFSLAKASSGNVELKMETFEMNRLIDQIFADMDDRMKESGLEFITQKTEESTELVSDNMYCYRICQNLLENALKYSAKGTRVFVKTYVKDGEEKDRKICLEMTNTAGYFMDFTKEDIVERFARGDKARTSEGNGLGLAIVSTYTKALGGEFDIRIDCDQFRAVVELPAENAGVRSPEQVQFQSKAENHIEEKKGKAL